MRTFFLTGSIVMTTVILVLAFENIQANCNYLTFFFWEISSGTPPTMTIFIEAILGIVTGIFYTLLMKSLMAPNEDEEDEDY